MDKKLAQITKLNNQFSRLFSDKTITITIPAKYLHTIQLLLAEEGYQQPENSKQREYLIMLANFLVNEIVKKFPQAKQLYERMQNALLG